MTPRDERLRDPAFFEFWVEDRVRFSDQDAGGHVNNTAIAQYVETGRVTYLRDRLPVRADGSRFDAAGFDVEELDPTGAGDCFGGAYVACRRLGMAPDQALTYANAAGARNVTVRGPMEGAGTRAELDDFISKTGRIG